MASWTAGPLQQLMRSSPFPWRSPIVLMKFLITESIIQITMARTTMAASHGNRKMTTSNGKTEIINHGKTEIINHSKTRITSHGKTTKAKTINPMTPVLHCLKIKSFLFQWIVTKMCSRSSVPWSKHRLTKQNNRVAMGKRLMK